MAKLSLLVLASLFLGSTFLLTDHFIQDSGADEATEHSARVLAREVAMAGLSDARQATFDTVLVPAATVYQREGTAHGGTYRATITRNDGGVMIHVRAWLGHETYTVERQYSYPPEGHHPRLRGQLHHLPR